MASGNKLREYGLKAARRAAAVPEAPIPSNKSRKTPEYQRFRGFFMPKAFCFALSDSDEKTAVDFELRFRRLAILYLKQPQAFCGTGTNLRRCSFAHV